jgi:hypothetical protein
VVGRGRLHIATWEAGRRWKDEDLPKNQWQLPGFLWFPAADLYGIQRVEYLDDVLVLCSASGSIEPVAAHSSEKREALDAGKSSLERSPLVTRLGVRAG